jgi:hypothetical protein
MLLLAVVLAGLFRPRKGLLDECAISLRVWPNDLGSGQVPSADLLAAARHLGAPAREMPEAIRLWQEAEGADRSRP